MYKMCVGEYGLSPDQFWDSTPRELGLVITGIIDRQKREAELLQVVVATGYASAKKGKMIKMFPKSRKPGELAPEMKKKAEKTFDSFLDKVVSK